MLTAVMMDTREPNHIRALQFGGVPVAPVALECGDLWASCADGAMLVVERKAPNDLLASIKDGRLFQQAAAMRARSAWAYVVVTGILTDSLDGHVVTNNRTSGWRWPDVMGALLTVQELGVAVTFCAGDEQYEDCVLRLARRERDNQKVLAPRTASRVLTPAETILTSLPGIGLERAQRILDYWQGNPALSLAWLTWLGTVLEIDGIGNGTKHQIRRALGLKDDEWITVFTPEASQYAAKVAADVYQAERTVVGLPTQAGAPHQASSNGGSGTNGGAISSALPGVQVSLL